MKKNVIWIFLAITCLILTFFVRKQNLNDSEVEVKTKSSKSLPKNEQESEVKEMSAAKKKLVKRIRESGIPWEGPKAVHLDLDQINTIKKSLNENSRVIREEQNEEPFLSSKEAFDFLTGSISMAAFGIPKIYFEDSC